MRTLFTQEEKESSQTTVQLQRWALPMLKLGNIPDSFRDVRILMELPDGLSRMPLERIKAYYPYKDRPEVILSDPEEQIPVTIQVLNATIKSEQIHPAATQMCNLMRKNFPGNPLSPVYLSTEGSIPVGWFLMEMPERGWEHAKAIFSIDKQAVLLTVTYPMSLCDKWRPVLEHVFASIEWDRENPKVS